MRRIASRYLNAAANVSQPSDKMQAEITAERLRFEKKIKKLTERYEGYKAHLRDDFALMKKRLLESMDAKIKKNSQEIDKKVANWKLEEQEKLVKSRQLAFKVKHEVAQSTLLSLANCRQDWLVSDSSVVVPRKDSDDILVNWNIASQ